MTPSLIRSTQLTTFSTAGTQAALRGELCFLCLQYGASRYYTTASASPATNIPTTTAVSTTVKSSVLVGNQHSWINTEKERWNIYLIIIVLQISNRICQYGVLMYWIGNLPSVNCTTPHTPPSICLVSSHFVSSHKRLFLSVLHNWKYSWEVTLSWFLFHSCTLFLPLLWNTDWGSK